MRTAKQDNLINEFTNYDIHKTVCRNCSCSVCEDADCICHCSAMVPCDSPVIICEDYARPKHN